MPSRTRAGEGDAPSPPGVEERALGLTGYLEQWLDFVVPRRDVVVGDGPRVGFARARCVRKVFRGEARNGAAPVIREPTGRQFLKDAGARVARRGDSGALHQGLSMLEHGQPEDARRHSRRRVLRTGLEHQDFGPRAAKKHSRRSPCRPTANDHDPAVRIACHAPSLHEGERRAKASEFGLSRRYESRDTPRVQTRVFGSTDLIVSEFGLGCARIGGIFQRDPAGFLDLLSGARDAGINFFDTADMYSQGESEVLVGRAFRQNRERVVISSKAG